MVDRDVRWSVISSVETTYFFHRDKKTRTLRMSRPYRHDDAPILAFFTFIDLALGGIPMKDIKFPLANTTRCDNCRGHGLRAGFDER